MNVEELKKKTERLNSSHEKEFKEVPDDNN